MLVKYFRYDSTSILRFRIKENIWHKNLMKKHSIIMFIVIILVRFIHFYGGYGFPPRRDVIFASSFPQFVYANGAECASFLVVKNRISRCELNVWFNISEAFKLSVSVFKRIIGLLEYMQVRRTQRNQGKMGVQFFPI